MFNKFKDKEEQEEIILTSMRLTIVSGTNSLTH